MRKKLMLIVNPVAGRGAYKADFADALHELYEGGYDTTVFFTAGPGDGKRLASERAADFDTVACIGGDGTLSDVLSGLVKLENPPDVGYFPMGTANDVATTLGLPKNDPINAARMMVGGTPHPFDVGGFGEDKYFAYIAAFGAFTEVSYATPQDQKKLLGHLAYVLQGASQLGKIESVRTRVEYDDGVFEGDLLYGSMSNSTSVAGIVRLPENMVSLGDGMSELVLVKEPDGFIGFSEMVDSVLSQRFDCDDLVILHTRKAVFSFDKPVAWTRDGEAGGEYTRVELCNYHAPVKLIF